MSDNFDIIITDLATKAFNYHCKANEYREKGELEGALINYLLSTNNLYMIKKAIPGDNRDLSEAIQNSNCSSKESLVNNIDDALKKNIRWIVPLQEKLRKIKKNRSARDDDNDKETEINCKNIKMTILNKGDCLTFADVAGQETAKKQIRNGILDPILDPGLFPISSKGILLYGVPGTGKTLLAKAFANELQLEASKRGKDIRILFYAPTGSSLKGKYVGQTEKNITRYFECASKQAKLCEKAIQKADGYYYMQKLDKKGEPQFFEDSQGKKPVMEAIKYNGIAPPLRKTIAVLFIDEIEAIAGDRSKDESGLMTNSVNTLLQMMDGVKSFSNVVVMAATNYPWKLDDAILRRFDTKILVSPPKKSDVETLIKIQIANFISKAIKINEINFDLVEKKSNSKLCNPGNCNQNKDGNVNNEELLKTYQKQFSSESDDAKKAELNEKIERLEYYVGLHNQDSDKINTSVYGYPKNKLMPNVTQNVSFSGEEETHKINEDYSGYIPPAVCCGSTEKEDKTCLNLPCLGKNSKITPLEIFEFYRKHYFSHFTDGEISKIAEVYSDPKTPFSGGDVANACKAVFKKMGSKALENNKWSPTFIENPILLKDKNNNIKPRHRLKEENSYLKDKFNKNYQYLLYDPYGQGFNFGSRDNETYLVFPKSNFFKGIQDIGYNFGRRFRTGDTHKVKPNDLEKEDPLIEKNNLISIRKKVKSVIDSGTEKQQGGSSSGDNESLENKLKEQIDAFKTNPLKDDGDIKSLDVLELQDISGNETKKETLIKKLLDSLYLEGYGLVDIPDDLCKKIQEILPEVDFEISNICKKSSSDECSLPEIGKSNFEFKMDKDKDIMSRQLICEDHIDGDDESFTTDTAGPDDEDDDNNDDESDGESGSDGVKPDGDADSNDNSEKPENKQDTSESDDDSHGNKNPVDDAESDDDDDSINSTPQHEEQDPTPQQVDQEQNPIQAQNLILERDKVSEVLNKIRKNPFSKAVDLIDNLRNATDKAQTIDILENIMKRANLLKRINRIRQKKKIKKNGNDHKLITWYNRIKKKDISSIEELITEIDKWLNKKKTPS